MNVPPLDSAGQAIRRRATEWLALQHLRPLTLNEQADFAEWTAADPRHAKMFSELKGTWNSFDRLAAWPHSADRPPDPDLFKRPAKVIAWRLPVGLAAAAAIAVAAVVWFKPWAESGQPAQSIAAVSPLRQLPDGSVVELKTGSEIREHYTEAERRVQLVRGEAHFAVAKNPNRPFIVEANGVAVRAVGTAFDVKLAATAVEILVTEGTVQVAPPTSNLPSPGSDPTPGEITTLTIGQRTVVSTISAPTPVAPVVENLAAAEIDRALAWQSSRFAFEDMPLADVVARLNQQTARRPGAPRLVIGDASLGALKISGRVRADSVDNFVDVLESSFGVRAENTASGEIILRRAARP